MIFNRKNTTEKGLRWLNESAVKMMALKTPDQLYSFIAESIHKRVGKSIVIVTKINIKNYDVDIIKVVGLGNADLARAVKILGFNPFESKYKISEHRFNRFLAGRLFNLQYKVIELGKNKITNSNIDLAAKQLGIKQIYSGGMVNEGQLLAGIHLVLFKQLPKTDLNIIESFISLAAIICNKHKLTNDLKISETRFKNLIKNIPGVPYRCVLNGKLKVEFIGDEIETLSGYKAVDFINNQRVYANIIVNEYKTLVANAIKTAIKTKSEFAIEYLITTSTNQQKWVSEKGRVSSQNGNDIIIDGILNDITSEREVKQQLIDSEEKFRSMFESSNLSISIFNKKGYLMVNKAWIEQSGYSFDEALQLDPLLIIHPDEREQRRQMLADSFLGKPVQTGYVAHLVDKYGNDKYMELSTSLIKYEGQTAVMVSAFDVTERRKSELELQKFSTIIMNSPSSILITDQHGNIEYVNPFFSESTGYSPTEIIGQNPRILQSGLTEPRIFTDLWQTISKGSVWNGELINRKKNGDIYYETVRIAPVLNNMRKITNFIAIKEDITQLKRNQETLEKTASELHELNAKKDKFFSIIAHDLRSPFTGLVGITDLLYKNFKELDTKKTEYYLKHANESATKVFKLLENLLEWARAQTGRIEYKPELFKLYDIIDDALGLVKIAADTKQIILINSVNANHMVYVDKNMLFTVLRNLVSNALKYTNVNGVIEISSTLKSDMVEVSVADNGVGIPEQHLNKLFKIEENFTTAGTNSEKGSGLGLILSYELVKKLGGNIYCNSTVGVGTTFSFTIPMYREF